MELKEVPLAPHVFDYWKLVVAGYEKLLGRQPGYDSTGLPEYEYLSFFVFAHHIVDHILFDQSDDLREAVDSFVQSNTALRQCDEVCNTTKHFELTRRRNRGHRRPGYDESQITVVIGDDGNVADVDSHRMLTFHDGSQTDAMDLARGVVLAWHGLGLPLAPHLT